MPRRYRKHETTLWLTNIYIFMTIYTPTTLTANRFV
jgi:hypothetical protein